MLQRAHFRLWEVNPAPSPQLRERMEERPRLWPLSAHPVPGKAPIPVIQYRAASEDIGARRDQAVLDQGPKNKEATLRAPGGWLPPAPWKRSLTSKQAGV